MRSTEKTVGWKTTLLVSALLLLLAGGVVAAIFSTEPTAARGGATRRGAMVVDVVEVERGTFRPEIVATGTVMADKDIVLSPRVAGQVVGLAPELTPGGFVEEGDVLVRIDAADYRNVLAQRQSDLRQALSDLEIEMGRQQVAERELDLFDEDVPEESRGRALRQPQLEAARVRVDAARAAVEQARIDLGRTRITAPFTGQILTREVNVGSQVAAGEPLGRLVGVESYWVEVTVPRPKLRWLSFPGGDGGQGSEVVVRNRGAWPDGVHRTGHLQRLIGALDTRTRMARIIAAIPDPLARSEDTPDDAPILMIGDFLEARIRGNEVADVVRLDRRYLREGDTVWVMEDGALAIRDVEVVLADERYAYISGGLDEGDRVVTTHLSTVSQGAPLRVERSPEEAPAADAGPESE